TDCRTRQNKSNLHCYSYSVVQHSFLHFGPFSATAPRFLVHLRPSQALLIFFRHSFLPNLLLSCSGYIEQLSEGGCQSCCPLSKPSISNASSLGRHRIRPRGLLARLDKRRKPGPDP